VYEVSDAVKRGNPPKQSYIVEATKGGIQRDSMIPNIEKGREREKFINLKFGINAIPLDASSSCSGI